jgi:hypothetical protein
MGFVENAGQTRIQNRIKAFVQETHQAGVPDKFFKRYLYMVMYNFFQTFNAGFTT